MKLLLDLPNVRIALFEATHEAAPWSALNQADLDIAAVALGSPAGIRSAAQVHGDRILETHEHGDADGFYLEAGHAAVVRHADCIPVAVADPVRSTAVLLHCGWRGCAMGLARKGVRRLLVGGSDPADLIATLGPGIGPADFEVGPEVLASFPEPVHSLTSRGTPSIDLPAFLLGELEGSGLLRSRITCDFRSTIGDLNLHSHRREGSRSGRMATFCLISPKFGVP